MRRQSNCRAEGCASFARRLHTRRCGLAAATVLAGCLTMQAPAYAQDAGQLASIQRQISALQAQLKRLQHEAAQRDAALRNAQADASQARVEAAQAVKNTASYAAAAHGAPLTSPPGYYPPGPSAGSGLALGTPNPNATSLQGASPPSITQTSVDKNNPTFKVGGVTITLGGFIDATFLTRSANLTSGNSTSYNAIPFNNSVNAHIGEFRESAQYTRFSTLVQGAVSDNLKLAGYIEGDFAGAATTANSVQTNGYTPRLRQAYATIDDTLDGLHILAGQAYTLATGSTVGITPRKEALPPVIDGNNLPGFTYLRQAQLRIVKDFGGKLWLGASLEEPQETYSAAGITSGGTLPDKSTITFTNPGGSFLNSTANYSFDTAPDMIIKAAVDTGFGHFEAFGLGRFFRDRVTTVVANGSNSTVFGGGVGGSMVVPVLPKKLDLVGNVLAGDGIGRYMPGQLPDATFDAQGRPVPLPEIGGMVGLIGHPVKSVDLYALVSEETDRASSFAISTTSKGVTTTTGYGYGSPYANNSQCEVELGTKCAAQTRAIQDLSVGGWWRVLHGSYGTVQLGVEYSYVQRIAFSGIGGRPKANENIGYVTVRFLPFQ